MTEQKSRYVAGIDEAGRGPVMGPLVYAICAIPIFYKKEFDRKKSITDSKKLKPTKRETLAEEIKNDVLVKYKIDQVSASSISALMQLPDKVNLNRISHTSIFWLVSQISKSVFLDTVYVDTVGTPTTLASALRTRFPATNFVVESKADAKYKVVSAASILAKTARDKAIRNYESEKGLSVGSGYPSDPLTKQHLQEIVDKCAGFDSFYRYSWQTAQKVIEKCCDKVEIGNQKEFLETESIFDILGVESSCS